MEMEEGAPAPEQGGGKEAETMLKGISMALTKASDILPQLGAAEEDVQAMGSIVEQYQQIMSRVLGGEAQGPQPAQGQAPMEAGPNGKPMM